jgi:hypothetical protein
MICFVFQIFFTSVYTLRCNSGAGLPGAKRGSSGNALAVCNIQPPDRTGISALTKFTYTCLAVPRENLRERGGPSAAWPHSDLQLCDPNSILGDFIATLRPRVRVSWHHWSTRIYWYSNCRLFHCQFNVEQIRFYLEHFWQLRGLSLLANYTDSDRRCRRS